MMTIITVVTECLWVIDGILPLSHRKNRLTEEIVVQMENQELPGRNMPQEQVRSCERSDQLPLSHGQPV
ncbi:MAG: hypothetical protein RQ714_07675 [Nitrosomonas sp.]|nr:hypothetical protein [Nitrosomonas sp.]